MSPGSGGALMSSDDEGEGGEGRGDVGQGQAGVGIYKAKYKKAKKGKRQWRDEALQWKAAYYALREQLSARQPWPQQVPAMGQAAWPQLAGAAPPRLDAPGSGCAGLDPSRASVPRAPAAAACCPLKSVSSCGAAAIEGPKPQPSAA